MLNLEHWRTNLFIITGSVNMNHYLSTDPAGCKSRVEFFMASSLGTNGVIVITTSSPHSLVSYILDEFFKYNI